MLGVSISAGLGVEVVYIGGTGSPAPSDSLTDDEGVPLTDDNGMYLTAG